MRPVNSRPRFHCDFCSKVSTKEAMERHERICWKNPDRVCDSCDNRGYYTEDYGVDGAIAERIPCYYCSKRADVSVTG